MPLGNVTKEMDRFAMRDGHATEDFSAIYELIADTDHPLPPPMRRDLSLGDYVTTLIASCLIMHR